MTEHILLFPSTPPDLLKEIPSSRPTVPADKADAMVLSSLGGATMQVQLISQYFLSVGEVEFAEKIGAAAGTLNELLKTRLK